MLGIIRPKVNPTTSFEDQMGLKPQTHCIQCGELYAIVCCESQYENGIDFLLEQKGCESRVVYPAIVKEATVAVDFPVDPFAENPCPTSLIEAGSEVGAMGLLDAVNGPENLRNAVQVYNLADTPALVVSSEAAVVGWMPVLGGYHQVEAILLPVGDRNHLVPVRNGQSATGQKV